MKAKLLVLSFLLLVGMLVGCGGTTASAEPSYFVNILVYGTTVDPTAADTFSADLNTAFPDLAQKADGIGCTQYSNGQSPEGITANMDKIAINMSAQELSIIIADQGGMNRLAASSAFTPISEVFTAEELATIPYSTLKYQKVAADGSLEGDPVEYGWDVSESAALKSMLVDDKALGIGLVAKGRQTGYSKDILLHILTQK